MAVLEWGTLVVCGTVLLLRVPDAVRGRNRTVFGILLLATLCSLLAVSGPYEAIDSVLGGWNLTHLILRFLVFATVLLVGLRVMRGLASARGYRLIAGRPGRWALGVCCAAVAVIFFLMDTRGSSAGLESLSVGGGRNAVLAPFYAAAGRSYPAFVSLILAAPLLAAVRSQLPRLVRAASLVTLLGALAVVVSIPASFAPPEWALGQHVINYSAVLGYVLGLALFWFSGLNDSKSGNAHATLNKNSE
ncbi:hypothetical protein [Arthrobacter sp. CG_A4]|uniref:hypothetical protein n=1 Tax=Arthrobacter sp. CG_A4 TaxID=3071706 RepID=UPI002E09D7CE|nr:hypothetical protein [Arthrobacter sp. CG_A4]